MSLGLEQFGRSEMFSASEQGKHSLPLMLGVGIDHHQLQQQQQQQQHQQSLRLAGVSLMPAEWSMPSSIVVKQEPHQHLQEDRNNDSGISPGHYESESGSPQSQPRTTSTGGASEGCPSPNSTCSSSNVDSSTFNVNMAGIQNQQQQQQLNPMGSYVFSSPGLHSGSLSMLYSQMQQHSYPTSSSASLPDNSDVGSPSSACSANDMSSSGQIDVKPIVRLSPNPLQCPLCTFSSQSRLQFTEHLARHCSTATSPTPDEFVRSVMDQLTRGGTVGCGPNDIKPDIKRMTPSPMSTNESTTADLDGPLAAPSESLNMSGSGKTMGEGEFEDDPGLRVPRVNSQGKVKTFKCKQCSYVGITKIDFWTHCRTHIRKEKLLECPKCPFVTEYKHHLEYHLRNHMGVKPYKCDQCDYSCVNKSMLNSHLKSHSKVYQFSCSQCSYCSKYCHSLKIHLRRYNHEPAMVLNPDGTPNPLPIVDVYGKKRGPKSRTSVGGAVNKEQRQQRHLQQQSPGGTKSGHQVVSRGTSPQAPSTAPPTPMPESSPSSSTSSSTDASLSLHPVPIAPRPAAPAVTVSLGQVQPGQIAPVLFTAAQLQQQLGSVNGFAAGLGLALGATPMFGFPFGAQGLIATNFGSPQSTGPFVASTAASQLNAGCLVFANPGQTLQQQQQQQQVSNQTGLGDNEEPQDLSKKPKKEPAVTQEAETPTPASAMPLDLTVSATVAPSSPTELPAKSSSRRKGKAFKLDRSSFH